MTNAPAPPSRLTLLAVAFVVTLPLVGGTIFIPVMPLIATNLGSAEDTIQLSVALYLAALGISQLAYGPISDRAGRLPVLRVALLVMLAGSVLAALAPSGAAFLAARVVQGLGAGGASCLPLAMGAQLFDREAFPRVTRLAMGVRSLTSIAAPLGGAYLERESGWRAIFVVLAALAVVALGLAQWGLRGEAAATSGAAVGSSGEPPRWRDLLAARSFLPGVMVLTLMYALTVVYSTITPFLFQNELGLSSVQYSHLVLLTVPVYLAGAALSGHVTAWLGLRGGTRLAIAVAVLASLGLAVVSWQARLAVWSLLLPMLLAFACVGVLLPGLTAATVQQQPGATGTASGLLGFVQVTGCGVVAALAAPDLIHPAHHLAALFLALTVLAGVAAVWLPASGPLTTDHARADSEGARA